MIAVATYSYNKELIEALERNRDIVISTLRYPKWHMFIYIGEE